MLFGIEEMPEARDPRLTRTLGSRRAAPTWARSSAMVDAMKRTAAVALALVACAPPVPTPRDSTATHAIVPESERSAGGLATIDGGVAQEKGQAALETGVQAVLYGLPLVMMHLTMQNATNVESPTRAMAAPVNQFANARAFPNADFKQVVRANVDTLYSSAFLDLSKEPLLLSVPETKRYHLLPMFDAWTNVFASPGTRTTRGGAGTFAIVGPDWNGALPPGCRR